MCLDYVTQIVSEALYTVIITSAPPLLVSLVVGLVVSIFQTVTSIQEQTLTFVPKILLVFLSLILAGNWISNTLVTFMQNLWSDFTVYIR